VLADHQGGYVQDLRLREDDMGTMGMVGFGVVSGPSSLVSKSLGGEARGRPVMVNMVRMRKERTEGEIYKRPLKAKKQG
jgi:hypothetical protein